MSRAISVALGILVAFATATVLAGGALKIQFTGIPPENLKDVRVEVLVKDGDQAKVAFRNDASEIPHEGLALPPGNYQVYLEDKETGLIVPLDADGKGRQVPEQGVVRADVADFGRRVREIKEKDKREHAAKAELLARHKGRKSVFAVDGPAPDAPASSTTEPDLHAPGELLVKFQPNTTLADRYRVFEEIIAESRSKLQALDVYRVKVSDTADLQALIGAFVGDPRVKYMEMNVVVSVPEPVGEDQ